MSLIKRLEAFSHRRCVSAMRHMRQDLIQMNADRALLAQDLVTARRYADDLAEELESLKAGL